MADDIYVVTGTQLNRRVKDEDGDWGSANIPRNTEFAVGATFSDDDPGVTEREIKRWLDLRPRVLVSKADLEEAQRTATQQSDLIADLQAQLAEANAKVAAAVAQGADLGDGSDPTNGIAPAGGGTLEQPTGNGSAEDWRAYATQQDPDNAEAIATMSRDDLRNKYSKAS